MRTAEVYHELSGASDSPVLVLAGPLGGTREIWDPLVEALSERFRVLRYDHRGHGRSPAPVDPSRSWIWPSMRWRCCSAIAGWDGRRSLGRINTPTLVIGGSQDSGTPINPYARSLVVAIYRAKLEVFDGAHLALFVA